MTIILSSDSVNVIQKDFLQVLLRGNGGDQFNQIIAKEISINPPSKNLEISSNDKYIFAKNSFDQWSLLYLVEQDYKKILNAMLDRKLQSVYGSRVLGKKRYSVKNFTSKSLSNVNNNGFLLSLVFINSSLLNIII